MASYHWELKTQHFQLPTQMQRHGTSGTTQWIGLREILQETMVFTIKYRGFSG